MKISKIYRNLDNVKLGDKLKFVNSLALFVPMVVSLIFMFVFYLSMTSDNSYVSQLNVNNVDFAYDSYVSVKEEIEKIEPGSKVDYSSILPDKDDFKTVFAQVKKNNETVYRSSLIEDGEYETFFGCVKDTKDQKFLISDDNIIFRIVTEKNGDSYDVFAVGKVEKISSLKKNADFFLRFFFINSVLLIAVILFVHFYSRFLTKLVFKRVDYSLNLLRRAIQKVGAGNLDYRIKYYRNDEFKPTCDSFNEMVDALQESTDEIKKNEQTRKDLLMSISHDIFSPLTSINAYAEGILNGIAQTEETKLKYAKVIKNKAAEIESMVSSLLFLSKLEYGEVSINLEKIKLNELLKDYVDSANPDYAFKNLNITLVQNDEVRINGESKLLFRVFNNLLDNSAKYKNKDVGQVEISLVSNGEQCNLIFKDDGPGVSEENIDKIFELFYRSDKTRSSGNGNGIGLSIVDNIVRLHNGTVKAQNASSGGLEIIITLPTDKGD